MTVALTRKSTPVLGDVHTIRGYVIDSYTREAVDISGLKVTLRIKSISDDTDESAILEVDSVADLSNFNLDDAASGRYIVYILPENQTSLIEGKKYWIETEIEFVNGPVTHIFSPISFV